MKPTKKKFKRKIHPKGKGRNNKKRSKSNQQMAPKNANAQKRATTPSKGRQHNNLCLTPFTCWCEVNQTKRWARKLKQHQV
jgi:hypothetical protein